MNKIIANFKVYYAAVKIFPEVYRELSLLNEIKEMEQEEIKPMRAVLLRAVRQDAAIDVVKCRLSPDFYDKVFSPTGINFDFVHSCTASDLVYENLKKKLGLTDEDFKTARKEAR